MSAPTDAIREHLMVSNAEYQHLKEEHSRYARQLEELEAKSYLTEVEKVEEIRLKKLKLRLKDEMETLVQRARVTS